MSDQIATRVAEEERHKKDKAESAHLTLHSGMKNFSINAASKKNFKKEGSKKNLNQKGYQKGN